MTALQRLVHLSEQEYLAAELTAELRHEYVDGQLYAMAGASERHNRISLNVGFHLRAAARGGHCGVFVSDMKLKIAWRNAYYYPDVMLVCNAQDKGEYYKQQPCFIAEVLSSSTASIDRREKLLAYQKIPGLRYYLLVSSEQKQVEYFVRDAQDEWQTALLEADETLAIDCDSFHAVLSLADIYEDVVFNNV
ncbi:MAG: Uma2 family endonuclease [Methylococcales bacterium]|nr:MAG: Uma2 family endonuclease [Methylococcales bacterium]